MADTGARKRPSRLLNLNKASAPNKRVSSNNAIHSPLLSLPPELRSRIWGYVFHVGVIHVARSISNGTSRYERYVCQRSEVYERALPRFSQGETPEYLKGTTLDQEVLKDHQDCIWNTAVRKPLHQHLHLDFLRTCRLIYHEAVFIPFSINRFQSIFWRYGSHPMLQLMDAMVTAQVRAVKHLCLISYEGGFMRDKDVQRLKGLEHVDLKIHLWCSTEVEVRQCMERLLEGSGVTALSSLALKSLYMNIDLKNKTLQLTNADVEALVARLKDTEDKLLNRIPTNNKLDQ